MDKGVITKYIHNRTENENFDVKCCYYHEKKKYDLIKDVLAFANASSVGDKYIVFNINNDTFQLCNMDMSTLPDISDINTLLREYCEPNIDVGLGRFTFNGGQVAYLKICKTNLDYPYMMKKDYIAEGKVKLHQGQIYVRRGATNFIANRLDLDTLIEMRVSRTIRIESQSTEKKQFVVDKQAVSMFSSPFIFTNTAKTNYLVKSAKINLKTLRMAVSIEVSFIADANTQSFKSNNSPNIALLDVVSNSTIQKTVYFEISSECENLLKQSDKINATLILNDVNDNEVVSNTELWSIEND